MKCTLCEDSGWICEEHPGRPWGDGPHACPCGAAGMPCPRCNQRAEGQAPATAAGEVQDQASLNDPCDIVAQGSVVEYVGTKPSQACSKGSSAIAGLS